MKERLEKIIEKIKQEKIDCLFITNLVNISYLTDFKGGEATALLIPEEKNFLITDGRFSQEASELRDFEIKITNNFLPEFLLEIINSKVKRFGFEANSLSYKQYLQLREKLTGVELVATFGLVEELRRIKDESEIKIIREAISITGKVFETINSELKPGISEKELADKIELLIRKNGATRTAFETIVATSYNSVSPHARPTERIIEQGDTVLIDMGAYYNGYNSDLTRVLFLDRITEDKKKIYKIINEAQEIAVKEIRPGKKARDIEQKVRSFLQEKNLDKYFLHSLGHGIGREVHEEPYISLTSDREIKKGEVFTIEPALYIPEIGGFRIEDMVWVKNDGYELLSRSVVR